MVLSIMESSKTLEFMREWAVKYQIAIGGSYLEFDTEKQEIYTRNTLPTIIQMSKEVI